MNKGLTGLFIFAVVASRGVTAYAHGPGPTNFLSEVVSISPDHRGLTASIIGGDSFLDLKVSPGTDVVVVGYKGERYLHFLADGTVEENVASVTHYSNKSRFGAAIPDDADPPAAERWRIVSYRGQWAWHDHRTHWMNSFDPPGRHRGDVILEGVVPLTVDGQAVSITVRSIWLASPSVLWPALMSLGGLGIAAVAVYVGWWASTALFGAVAAAGLFVGIRQYLSVPIALGPDRLAWLLPGVCLLSVTLVLIGRERMTRPTSAAIRAFASVELLAWIWLRRTTLSRAVLATYPPYWLDRGITAMCVGVTIPVAVVSFRTVIKIRPTPVPASLEGRSG